MAININASPNSEKAKKAKNAKASKEDPDFAMFAAMTADEAAQWVEDNCTADPDVIVVLKVMMKTFTAISGDL